MKAPSGCKLNQRVPRIRDHRWFNPTNCVYAFFALPCPTLPHTWGITFLVLSCTVLPITSSLAQTIPFLTSPQPGPLPYPPPPFHSHPSYSHTHFPSHYYFQIHLFFRCEVDLLLVIPHVLFLLSLIITSPSSLPKGGGKEGKEWGENYTVILYLSRAIDNVPYQRLLLSQIR